MLSNCIFTVVFDNSYLLFQLIAIVVNCFQIVFLLWSLTTKIEQIKIPFLLWIAFKLYFYCGLWQHSNLRYITHFVVNCFQIVFLLWSLTTFSKMPKRFFLLWIAFKLYFYCGLWQPTSRLLQLGVGCELLSNCIFTVVFDNRSRNAHWRPAVVNCFQIVFLLWSLTTASPEEFSFPVLWIAFKLYFYCGLWQLLGRFLKYRFCCELLSNCIFTVVFDNERIGR